MTTMKTIKLYFTYLNYRYRQILCSEVRPAESEDYIKIELVLPKIKEYDLLHFTCMEGCVLFSLYVKPNEVKKYIVSFWVIYLM